MASVRADIHTIRDYERFLKARGFSHKEAKHLASLSKPFFMDVPPKPSGLGQV